MSVVEGTTFLINATTGAVSIPTLKDISAVLGITIFDDFCLRITITAKIGSGIFRVHSNSDFNNVLKGYNGQDISYKNMGGGDTIILDLYKNGRDEWAQLIASVY